LSAGEVQAQRTELRHDPLIDGAVTLGVLSAYVGSQAAMGEIAPKACHWCESNGFDDAARKALRWENLRAADGLSNVGGFVLMPLVGVSSSLLGASQTGRFSDFGVDMLVITQAMSISMVLNQGVKLAFARQRPFVHANEDDPSRSPNPEDNVSFYSGHTTFAFSLATATGTVASMRRYRHAPWIWGCGLAMASAVGYLRIAADKHYLTDVLVGAVAGSAGGIALPYFLHGPKDAVTVAPLPGGLAITGAF
jgi:membrane-associated phospholipid phosphatase